MENAIRDLITFAGETSGDIDLVFGGYSHGASAAYHLSVLLENPQFIGDLRSPYEGFDDSLSEPLQELLDSGRLEIKGTYYNDGVKHSGDGPLDVTPGETRMPYGTPSHKHNWQTNDGGFNPGNPTGAPIDPEADSYDPTAELLETDYGGDLDHGGIDVDPGVLGDLRDHILIRLGRGGGGGGADDEGGDDGGGDEDGNSGGNGGGEGGQPPDNGGNGGEGDDDGQGDDAAGDEDGGTGGGSSGEGEDGDGDEEPDSGGDSSGDTGGGGGTGSGGGSGGGNGSSNPPGGWVQIGGGGWTSRPPELDYDEEEEDGLDLGEHGSTSEDVHDGGAEGGAADGQGNPSTSGSTDGASMPPTTFA